MVYEDIFFKKRKSVLHNEKNNNNNREVYRVLRPEPQRGASERAVHVHVNAVFMIIVLCGYPEREDVLRDGQGKQQKPDPQRVLGSKELCVYAGSNHTARQNLVRWAFSEELHLLLETQLIDAP